MIFLILNLQIICQFHWWFQLMISLTISIASRFIWRNKNENIEGALAQITMLHFWLKTNFCEDLKWKDFSYFQLMISISSRFICRNNKWKCGWDLSPNNNATLLAKAQFLWRFEWKGFSLFQIDIFILNWIFNLL